MNIFLLSENLSDEDRFTAHLHYLIECVPEVGQGLVNELLRQADQPTARFQKSETIPVLTPKIVRTFYFVAKTSTLSVSTSFGAHLATDNLSAI